MINVAIAGGAGYTAGELLRVLQNHPGVRVVSVVSSTSAKEEISVYHRDLLGATSLQFSKKEELYEMRGKVDLLFLCLGHGISRQFLQEVTMDKKCRIIDLGSDFRIDEKFGDENFVYGLPELNRNKIKNARLVANPGCFATSVILALAPLAIEGALADEIHIHSVTGSTGAGRTLSETSHFSNRESNISVYKPFTHQHLGEIGKTLGNISPKVIPEINFIPLRGGYTRGIFTSLYTRYSGNLNIGHLEEFFREYYFSSPFVHISRFPVSLKEVVNTNNAHIHLERHKDYLYIAVVIDNLLKGASGQAVQNMNLMTGFEEDCALRLKASAF